MIREPGSTLVLVRLRDWCEERRMEVSLHRFRRGCRKTCATVAHSSPPCCHHHFVEERPPLLLLAFRAAGTHFHPLAHTVISTHQITTHQITPTEATTCCRKRWQMRRAATAAAHSRCAWTTWRMSIPCSMPRSTSSRLCQGTHARRAPRTRSAEST